MFDECTSSSHSKFGTNLPTTRNLLHDKLRDVALLCHLHGPVSLSSALFFLAVKQGRKCLRLTPTKFLISRLEFE